VSIRIKLNDLSGEQLAAISRLFSSSVIQELAKKGKSPVFTRLVHESGLIGSIDTLETVRDLFDTAFSLLKREGYRDEYVYKAAVTHRILLGRYSLRTASMLTEFRVGECKADIAILNHTSRAYEVKSERDSLNRLQRQVTAYAGVFAQVYVIAAEDHVDAVRALVPEDIGLMRLSRRYELSYLRQAVDRPERTTPAAIFDSIRTEEAREILLSLGFRVPAVPNTELSSVLRESFIKLDPREAHDCMVRVLKKTRNLMPLKDLVMKLPHSLQTAALSIRLRKLDHARLIGAVNTRLEDAMSWGSNA
jgi:hypothetical protein